jgi:hypothetical protein
LLPALCLGLGVLGCGEPSTHQSSAPSTSGPVSDDAPYDSNPDHLWNRVFRHFHRRTTPDGTVYYLENMETPFQFGASSFSLEGAGGEKGIALLDEFLRSGADRLVKDPLKRAIFQRDLWAMFTATGEAELRKRLAKIMRKVALSVQEIEALPDNLENAVREKSFDAEFEGGRPDRPFLPPGLLDPSGRWVPFTRRDRETQPAAMAHIIFASGRAVFVPLLSLPKGGRATRDYIKGMKEERIPQFEVGTQVALLRRVVLVDDSGTPRVSPLTESLQIRVFDEVIDSEVGRPFEFILHRAEFFSGRSGGLHPIGREDRPRFDLRLCQGCHARLERGGVATLQTLRGGADVPGDMRVGRLQAALPTDLDSEGKKTLEWLQKTPGWALLKSLW